MRSSRITFLDASNGGTERKNARPNETVRVICMTNGGELQKLEVCEGERSGWFNAAALVDEQGEAGDREVYFAIVGSAKVSDFSTQGKTEHLPFAGLGVGCHDAQLLAGGIDKAE